MKPPNVSHKFTSRKFGILLFSRLGSLAVILSSGPKVFSLECFTSIVLLSWDRAGLGLLKTSNTINIRALKSIYLGYKHPSLKGIICWGNSINCKKLFTLQKRAVRYIVKAKKKKRESCIPYFKPFLILTSIYILQCDLFVRETTINL